MSAVNVFGHHRNFFANFYDPLGFFGNTRDKGDKGIDSPQSPNAPSVDQIQQDEKKKQQQRLAARTNTVYTSPLGINESPNLEKKSLLGG